MGKHKKQGKRKKTCQVDVQEENYKSAPHSFVFHRGHVGKNVKHLVSDTKSVMEPFTAKNLQVRKKNVLKDYVSVAGLLHVSHFIIYTKTDLGVYMRICRLPRGPTLTFKVHDYCLSSDVVSSLKKPNLEQMQYNHHPLLVMNNFTSKENHIKLMSSMFQNMFPSINVHKVRLNDVKRCVLVNYDTESNLIDFRHYNIKVVPVGMSRGVKKIVQAKVPNLSKYNDISEYMNRAGYSSESEVELDGPANEVILPQQMKARGSIKSAKSAVRLTELGPRLKLELIRIEEGVCDGQVMYHGFISKSEEEIQALKTMREKKKKLKESRRQQQEANLRKKEEGKQLHKEKSMEGIRRKLAEDNGIEDPGQEQPEYEEDDDVKFYKDEVGKLPDSDTFIPGVKRRKLDSKPPAQSSNKKMKIDTDDRKKKSNSIGKGKQDSNRKNYKENNDKKSKRENMTPLQKFMERKKKKKKQKIRKKAKQMGKGKGKKKI